MSYNTFMDPIIDNKKVFKYSVFLIFLIFIFNYLATYFYWYSSIWYFDMIMHFIGGVWLGFFSIYLFKINNLNLKLVFKILFFLLCVGVGWEIFEIIINNFTIRDDFNLLDTSSDLFFDMAGGMFAILYFFKKIMSIKQNTL